jgi:carboxypeptidase PM20D1
MSTWHWAGIGIAAVVVALIAIVIIRTETFEPPGATDLSGVRLTPHMAIDVDAAARHLGQAVRFQTISHQNASDNDWSQWDAQRAWLATTYPAFHAAAKLELPAGRTLLFTWAGSDPSLAPIILMAHQDVVPISPGTEKDWRHPPFSGEIAEGAVWGRGSIDDKASLIGIMEAVEALARAGFHPKRTIYIVSGHNEEVKGDGAQAAAELLKSRGVHADWVLDEGGTIETDEIITGRPIAKIGIAEKGYANIRITATGAGGHSSRPPKETAVTTLARGVIAVAEHPFKLHVGGVIRSELEALAPYAPWSMRMKIANLWLMERFLANELAATPTGAAMLHTTIAPTMLQGSPKANVLPQVATALVNFRIDPESNTAETMSHVKDAVGNLPVTLAFEDAFEPIRASSTTSDGWKAIAALAHDMSGAPVVPELMLASTDSSRFPEVARDIYRFVPEEIRNEDMRTMLHGTNEHTTLANLKRIIDFYERLIQMTAG